MSSAWFKLLLTNMATLGVVRDQMGFKTMWLYLLGIISSALFVGILVNMVSTGFEFNTASSHAHDMIPFVLQLMSLLLLLVVAVLPLFYTKAVEKSDCCD